MPLWIRTCRTRRAAAAPTIVTTSTAVVLHQGLFDCDCIAAGRSRCCCCGTQLLSSIQSILRPWTDLARRNRSTSRCNLNDQQPERRGLSARTSTGTAWYTAVSGAIRRSYPAFISRFDPEAVMRGPWSVHRGAWTDAKFKFKFNNLQPA
eukprot:SAG31_NODE_2903_length_4928_cov_6.524746_2_plen_150_part_00